jgi:hypothetical protein
VEPPAPQHRDGGAGRRPGDVTQFPPGGRRVFGDGDLDDLVAAQREVVNTGPVDSAQAIAFDQLSDCDLVLDRVCKGGTAGNAADDPLSRLLPA